MKNIKESGKRNNEKKREQQIFQVFVNNLKILPVWQILFQFLFASFEIHEYSYSYSYRSWFCKSIPIPIHGKNNYLLTTAMIHWHSAVTVHLCTVKCSTVNCRTLNLTTLQTLQKCAVECNEELHNTMQHSWKWDYTVQHIAIMYLIAVLQYGFLWLKSSNHRWGPGSRWDHS